MASLSRFVCCLSLAACGNSAGIAADATPAIDAVATGETDADGLADGAAAATDFGVAGPYQVSATTGAITSSGCELAYTLYSPTSSGAAPLVILGHGFSRSQNQLAGLAEHLASFGARVATPEYCHSSAFDTDHEQNGRDAAALSLALAGEGAPVIHAGQSAGGLAAVLAASQDASAVAVLALDMVDADDLALAAGATLSIPVFGMAGEPAQCNSNNNGVAMFQGPTQWVVRVNGATHCDFEDPTNGLCTAFCGGDGGGLPTIRTLAAAFVSWQFALDASGEAWSSPSGAEWQGLIDDGILSSL